MKTEEAKRVKKIDSEIANLKKRFDATFSLLKDSYIDRDIKDIKAMGQKLQNLVDKIAKREAIREEILLPQNVSISISEKELHDMIGDHQIEGEDIDRFIGEFVAMYLTDNFDHSVVEFSYHIGEEKIYVNSIRWNENQILKSDLKKLLKKRVKFIENDMVLLITTANPRGGIIFKNKIANYSQILTLKETIKKLKVLYII